MLSREHARQRLCKEILLIVLGLALGGAAGIRWSYQLGSNPCRNTLLPLLAQYVLPVVPIGKPLGVDDFSIRKGHRDSIILVDLTASTDRAAPRLAGEHFSSIRLCNGDRETAPSLTNLQVLQAKTQGAPEAVRVADPFHRLKKLADA